MYIMMTAALMISIMLVSIFSTTTTASREVPALQNIAQSQQVMQVAMAAKRWAAANPAATGAVPLSGVMSYMPAFTSANQVQSMLAQGGAVISIDGGGNRVISVTLSGLSPDAAGMVNYSVNVAATASAAAAQVVPGATPATTQVVPVPAPLSFPFFKGITSVVSQG